MKNGGIVHQHIQAAEFDDGLLDRGRDLGGSCGIGLDRNGSSSVGGDFQRYLAGPGGYVAEALALPTARGVAEAMVHGAADTTSGDPHGCLTVDDGPSLAEIREARVHQIAERFDDAVADGELSGVDTVVLARWISAVCQGIAIQARSGASRADLHALADVALAGWPTKLAAR